jgi:hypothetical protein
MRNTIGRLLQLRKKIRISQWFLIAVFIYAAFVSILYLRMENAERMLTEYYDARLCQSPANCREIVSADILDYGSKQISFVNYGSRGIPLDKGTFEEYSFTLSFGETETKTVKVVPGIPADIGQFDVPNIYIPSQSDRTIANTHLFYGKTVSAEIWRRRVTLIFVAVPTMDQANETTSEETLSIGPLSETHEIVLATNNHPVILAELSKADFTGWTSGLLFLGIPFFIFGSIVIGFIYGLDWLLRKGRARKEKD